ncbi:Aste57867_14148 [Aphanomyces stellatus]|uniref:Aste57867_14148 protein n=1 Tax=Aphanomyces stellatus TaxID=120398 RepID=A0A485L0V0_9STRA|nr:hypothetical protein As57867_014097 [Aphanomyces stellatus]VFT90974.1 Aste57867_14148 [Aphanomyces stellatus]
MQVSVKPRGGGSFVPPPPLPQAPAHSHAVLRTVAGVTYVALALIASCLYLTILEPAFSNDLWWTGFNVSGHQALLIDVVNDQLITQTNGTFDLLRATIAKRYDVPVSTTLIRHPYVRALGLTTLTSVDFAVKNLRLLSSHHSLWLATQFCYVDLAREFELAHTAGRQQRCARRYSSNGAVYMETMLRNQDWDAFVENYGGMFGISIQSWLEQVPSGVMWLERTALALPRTSVAQEAAYWRTNGIATFQLQWQNMWLMGITETMTIENALGMQQDILLKNLPRMFQTGTSIAMYWFPNNDLYAMVGLNRSLIRSANNSFTQRPAVDFQGFLGLQDMGGAGSIDAFRTAVGPFNSIDVFVVAVPLAVMSLYETFQTILFGELNRDPNACNGIADFELAPTPPLWTDRQFLWHGGNPLCLTNGPKPFIHESVDFYDNCATPTPLTVSFTKFSSAFAMLCADVRGISIPALCNMSTSPVQFCQDNFRAVLGSTVTFAPSFAPMSAHVGPAINAVQSLNISLMQFASTASNSNVTSMLYPLFYDPKWAVYDWSFVYDWVVGKREVLSFEGDRSTLVLISAADKPEVILSSTATVKGETKMIYYMVVYISLVLLCVGIVCSIDAILLKGQMHGPNFFWFNRVVGSIWIGRPLLFVRGVTATLLLSTSKLQPVQFLDGQTRFQLQPLTWIYSFIVAGEATWILFVAHDVMSVAIHELTPIYGPLNCFIAWVTFVIIEMASPVRPDVSLNRQCASDMDSYVQCATGVLQIGSFERLCLIFGVQAATCAGSIVVVWLALRHKNTPHHHARHILGIADVFFYPTHDNSMDATWTMDRVSCIMVGLVGLSWRRKKYIFDVKLWVLERNHFASAAANVLEFKLYHDGAKRSVSSARYAMDRPTTTTTEIKPKGSHLKTCVHVIMVLLGIAYVAMAIVSSVSYLQVSQVNLANDLYWATFNMTGAHAFLANWFNEQLVLSSPKAHFELNTNWINQDGSFDQLSASIKSSINLGSRMQYTELANIESSITGLRATDSCSVPWIFTPYCFVDFQQRWELANTATRQRRCQGMTTNGAVFLESILRNINFIAFESCWGPAFRVSIANELQRSQAGQRWLTDIVSSTSMADEIKLWTSYKITRFETQWQNFKHIGLVSSYSVTSMLGMDYPFTLQYQISQFRMDRQTTYKMYWGFANDLYAVMSNTSSIGGLSLIRSSPAYAFSNTSLQAVLIQNGTLGTPLGAAFTLLTTKVLGPFGAVDMRYVECPMQAKQAVRLMYQTLRRVLSAGNETQTAFNQISLAWSIYPAPKAWTDLNFVAVGGSPLCPDYGFASSTPISSGFSILTSWGFQCFQTPSFLNPSKEAMLASVVLANLTAPSSATVVSTCAQSFSLAKSCLLYMTQASTFLTTYFTPLDRAMVATASIDATAAIRALNVEFMQYGMHTPTSPLILYRTNVVEPTASEFTFYAWLYLVDWTLGFREAVSFEGDVGTLAVLTDYLDPLFQQVNLSENWVNVSLYLRNATLYVTYAMITLGLVVLVYIVLCCGHIEVLNLFLLQRMGAIVWVGRPLLFVRSLAAIGVLATCSLQLHTTGSISYFEVRDVPIYITLLAANEVTWLVAIVNDLGIVFTQECAAKYAGWNSLLVWVITAVLSVTAPVTHSASIETQCTLIQMDFQVQCTGGNVVIGHLSRFYTLVAIVILTNVSLYICCRVWLHWHPSSKQHVTSIFFYGGAKFQYRTAAWMHNGVYYMDRMSAVLNGILTIRHGHTIYAMDVKLWRTFTVQIPDMRDDDTGNERKQMSKFATAAFPVPQASTI